jgi:hypothetical protein
MKTTAYTAFNTVTPEAYPAIKHNRLKSYNGNYYLSNKTEFQLELYNPSNWYSVLCKIWINDKLISQSGIVLDTGQRVYLDRYLDSTRKFKFKVFDVDDVQETKEARERNGKVKVEFYQQYTINYWTTSMGTTTANFTHNTNTQLGNNTTTLTSSNINCRTVESGRIDEGGESNQMFTNSNKSFYTSPFHTVEFQLLPESLKQVNVKDIRNYCPNCGYRLRKDNWKFCPNCGEEL